MIVEEIIGGVTATILKDGKEVTLSVGDEFSDHDRSSVTVVGTGKLIVRVDQNCTVEIRGVEPEVVEEAPVIAKTIKVTKPAPVETPAVTETPAA
jgi:hypothetical protein